MSPLWADPPTGGSFFLLGICVICVYVCVCMCVCVCVCVCVHGVEDQGLICWGANDAFFNNRGRERRGGMFYSNRALLTTLVIFALANGFFVSAFRQLRYGACSMQLPSSSTRRQLLRMAMEPLSKPLVPHAAPTDTPSSLKDMTDRALEGLSRKKVFICLPKLRFPHHTPSSCIMHLH